MYLWAELQDSARLDRIDEKWGVEIGVLTEKLHSAGPGASFALVDLIERAWATKGGTEEMLALFSAAGVVEEERTE